MRWLVACVLCSGCELAFPLDAPSDAPGMPEIDAAAGCPAGYATVIGLPSKYRVPTTTAMWQEAEASCELDGAAHLAVPAQLTDMPTFVGLVGGARTWVGIARESNSTLDDYRTITGTPFSRTSSFWLTGEPDADGLAVEVANVGDDRLNDVLHTFQNRFVCECDGKPVVPFGL